MAVVAACLAVVVASAAVSPPGVCHRNERHKSHEKQSDDLLHFDFSLVLLVAAGLAGFVL